MPKTTERESILKLCENVEVIGFTELKCLMSVKKVFRLSQIEWNMTGHENLQA